MHEPVSACSRKLLAIGIYTGSTTHVALSKLPATRRGSGSVGAAALRPLLLLAAPRSATRVALFWAAHVVHHQSEDYNLSTALRQTSSGWLARLAVLPADGAARRAAAGVRHRRADRPAVPVLGAHAAGRQARLVRPLVLLAEQPSRAPRGERPLPRPELRRHPDRLGPPVRHLPAKRTTTSRASTARARRCAASIRCGPTSRFTPRWRTTLACAARGGTSCASGSSHRAGGRPTWPSGFRRRRFASNRCGATTHPRHVAHRCWR